MTETITIDVRIFATLREVIGVKKFFMTLDKGTTIREFLELIKEKFETGNAFIEAILDPNDPNRIKDYVKFMINGRILFHDDIFDSKLDNDGDVLAIFPPVAGG